MPVNSNKCNTCRHYDEIKLGNGTRKSRQGRCAVKSVYDAVTPQGQVSPPGVKRVEVGELARPVIVTGNAVVPHCTKYLANPAARK